MREAGASRIVPTDEREPARGEGRGRDGETWLTPCPLSCLAAGASSLLHVVRLVGFTSEHAQTRTLPSVLARPPAAAASSCERQQSASVRIDAAMNRRHINVYSGHDSPAALRCARLAFSGRSCRHYDVYTALAD